MAAARRMGARERKELVELFARKVEEAITAKEVAEGERLTKLFAARLKKLAKLKEKANHAVTTWLTAKDELAKVAAAQCPGYLVDNALHTIYSCYEREPLKRITVSTDYKIRAARLFKLKQEFADRLLLDAVNGEGAVEQLITEILTREGL